MLEQVMKVRDERESRSIFAFGYQDVAEIKDVVSTWLIKAQKMVDQFAEPPLTSEPLARKSSCLFLF